jgi:hypothetical protein
VFSGNAWFKVLEIADDTGLSDRDFALKTLIEQLVDPNDAPKIEALSDGDLTAALETCLAQERSWRGGTADADPSIAKLRAEVKRWAREERAKFQGLVDQMQKSISSLTHGMDLEIGKSTLGLLGPGSALGQAFTAQDRMVKDFASLWKGLDLNLPSGVTPNPSPVIAINPGVDAQLRAARGIRDLEATALDQGNKQLKALGDIARAMETLNAHQASQTTAAKESRDLMSRTFWVALIAMIIAAVTLLVAISGFRIDLRKSTPSTQTTPTPVLQSSRQVESEGLLLSLPRAAIATMASNRSVSRTATLWDSVMPNASIADTKR